MSFQYGFDYQSSQVSLSYDNRAVKTIYDDTSRVKVLALEVASFLKTYSENSTSSEMNIINTIITDRAIYYMNKRVEDKQAGRRWVNGEWDQYLIESSDLTAGQCEQLRSVIDHNKYCFVVPNEVNGAEDGVPLIAIVIKISEKVTAIKGIAIENLNLLQAELSRGEVRILTISQQASDALNLEITRLRQLSLSAYYNPPQIKPLIRLTSSKPDVPKRVVLSNTGIRTSSNLNKERPSIILQSSGLQSSTVNISTESTAQKTSEQQRLIPKSTRSETCCCKRDCTII